MVSKLSNIDIRNDTKGKLPRLPFAQIKNKILGTSYELSISFVTSKTSKKLNNEYRQKNYPTNILSFSLSKNSGELIIEPGCVKRDAPNFDMTYTSFLGFLLIHGMLHLKGFAHGSTMESKERYYKRVFGFTKRKTRIKK